MKSFFKGIFLVAFFIVSLWLIISDVAISQESYFWNKAAFYQHQNQPELAQQYTLKAMHYHEKHSKYWIQTVFEKLELYSMYE
jgi:hypothetical protein